MIRLLLLGSATITGGSAKPTHVLSQPKRLGVLAYLALARPLGMHRRDSLLALFWPELEQARARAALRQTLYVLRRALGENVVVCRGDEEVGIDPYRLWCDVVAFEDAVDRDSHELALELYRGDLLAGYHMPRSSAEFEEWLDSQRTRLRRLAAGAAHRLAVAEEARGGYVRAAAWALRASELSPFDETALRRRLALLDRSGDRAMACAEYEIFAARIRAELGVDPAPETEALVAGIRARQEPGAGRVSVDLEKDVLRDARESAGAAVASGPATRRWKRRGTAIAVAVVPLAAGLIWAAASRDAATIEPAHATSIAAPASDEPPPSTDPAAYDLYLGAMGLATRSPASNDAAIEMLRGSIELDPGFARAHAALANAFLHRVQMGLGPQWADSGIAAARRAIELDEDLAEGYRELAANMTWRGWLDDATEAFRRAVDLKPDYGAAVLGLGLALAWRGKVDEAFEQYRRAYALMPGNSTTALQIGVVYLALERYHEAERWLTRSLELEPNHALTLQVLAILELGRGDLDAARELADLLLALHPGHYRAISAAADVAFSAGETRAARRFLEPFHDADPGPRAGGVFLSPELRLAYALRAEGEASRAEALLGRIERAALSALQGGDQRYSVPLELAAAHAIRGDPEAAVDWLEEAVRAGFRMPVFVARSPLFESLRENRRYDAIMAGVRQELDRRAARIAEDPLPTAQDAPH